MGHLKYFNELYLILAYSIMKASNWNLPSVSGQVEGNTQTLLSSFDIGSVELIALLNRAETSVLEKENCGNWPRKMWQMKTQQLTHWGQVTHICVNKLTIIGSDNGLSPDRHQAIIGTNAGILLIGPLGTNFREILIEILTFSFKKMRLKVSSAKGWPFCLSLNVLPDGQALTWTSVDLSSKVFCNIHKKCLQI